MTTANYCICMCAHDSPLVRRPSEQARLSSMGDAYHCLRPLPSTAKHAFAPNQWLAVLKICVSRIEASAVLALGRMMPVVTPDYWTRLGSSWHRPAASAL